MAGPAPKSVNPLAFVDILLTPYSHPISTVTTLPNVLLRHPTPQYPLTPSRISCTCCTCCTCSTCCISGHSRP